MFISFVSLKDGQGYKEICRKKWKCVVMVGRLRMVFCFPYILLSLPLVQQVKTTYDEYTSSCSLSLSSPTIALSVPYLLLFRLERARPEQLFPGMAKHHSGTLLDMAVHE